MAGKSRSMHGALPCYASLTRTLLTYGCTLTYNGQERLSEMRYMERVYGSAVPNMYYNMHACSAVPNMYYNMHACSVVPNMYYNMHACMQCSTKHVL